MCRWLVDGATYYYIHYLAIVLSIIVLSLVPYYFAQISCAEEWEPFMGFI
jgi:hypothetical protein